MTEKQLQEILNLKSLKEFENKIQEVFPNGVDINKIDIKIKEKLQSLYNKDYSIDKPIQLKKNNI